MCAAAPAHATAAGVWVVDAVHSPCIDAGDPADGCSLEPLPNGGRINMGAYGNTPEASKPRATLTVVSTPVGGVSISGSHPGTASYSAVCTASETVLLVAPQRVTRNGRDYVFVKWTLDAADAPAGQMELSFAAIGVHNAAATYALAPPSTVSDLAAELTDLHSALAAAAASASSRLYNRYVPNYAADGDPATFWSGNASTAPRAEQLTLDLGTPQAVGRIRMLPRIGFAQLLPRAFSIDLSTDGTTWTTAATESGCVGQNGVWYEKAFSGYSARYVRLAVQATMRYAPNGLYYAQVAELEAHSQAEPAVQLAWTAPGVGNGGATGTADAYEVRWSTRPISTPAEWAAAAVIPSLPAPQAAGTRQSMLVSHRLLPDQARVYFAIRSVKDQTESDGSNSPFADTPGDVTPPAAITDLRAALADNPQVRLNAAAAACSSVLYSRYVAGLAIDLDPATFWSCTGTQTPRPEQLTVDLGSARLVGRVRMLPRSGFAQLFPANFAIMASTNGTNWAQAAAESGYAGSSGVWCEKDLGGVLARFLRLAIPATMRYAPNGLHYAQVAEFQVYPFRAIRLTWSAPGNDGLTGVASAYNVRWSTQAVGNAPAWAAAAALGGVPAPAAAKSQQSMDVIFSLPTGGRVFFAIKARDATGNESALSDSAYVDVPPGM